MNFAGNDNYKSDVTSEGTTRQEKGWFSSNVAQLMVFVNGLILTITAFATLNIFINEIVKEDLTHTSEDIVLDFFQSYSEIERSFDSLAVVLENMDRVDIEQTKKFIAKSYSDIERNGFHQIYIKHIQNDGRVVTTPLMKASSDVYKQTHWVENLRAVDDQKELRIVPRNEGIDVLMELSLMKAIINKSNHNLQLTSFLDVQHMMDKSIIDYGLSIQQIRIVDKKTDTDIYTYLSEVSDLSSMNSQNFINVSSVRFGNKDIEIRVALKINKRQAFLQKIPLLMLLFGVTLTLIGTLYVRNNQTQSRKLSAMNRELAHKNFELGQEISERERLSKVVQKSALENRSIINAVSDIIVELSSNGKIVFLNDAWVKVTGFQLDQSVGKSLFDLLHNNDQATERLNFASFVKGQKDSYRSFAKLRSANGLFRAIELSISMVRYDDDNNLRVVGTITDVEERRRAEKALSEAEKKYRAIVENAAGGIYQVTPEGQFLSANPALATVLGYDRPEEVLRDINKAQEQLYVDTAKRESFLISIQEQQESQSFEAQIRTKEGDVIWVRENVRPVFDDEKNLLFFEGSMEDVDQRKNAELALRDAKIESDLANRSKSEFLANMSHELRTPLNSIIGFSDIIKTQAFGAIDQKEYLEYAENIHESGNRLLSIINEILDVSRIETGNRTLNEGVVKVPEVVSGALLLMESKIKEASIRIENKTAQSDLSFIGESHAVKQMLINLLSNAVKFSPADSLIVLDTDIDDKGRLCLSVSDTGVGLTEEEIGKSLSAFGQTESDHNKTKSGTGLGLTLVRSLMDLHGGELEMVSQKGIGTTVTLVFPAKRVTQISSKETFEASVHQEEEVTKIKIEDSLIDE